MRRLRQIRQRVGREVTICLVLALVMSRIDYNNSALASLPQSTIAPLQRVQNAAARLVFELCTSDHVTASLLELHWLPVQWRIKFKLCCIMHSVFYGRCPAYLTATAQSLNASQLYLDQCLRSTSSTVFLLLQLHTKFGERAFTHAGSAAWNSLPEHIRAEPDIRVFRKLLTTNLFT